MWHLLAADNGDGISQDRLWELFFKDEYPEKLRQENKEWYLLPASQELVEAKYDIGETFATDEVKGSPQDKAGWYLRAAEQGYPPAQEKIADCYLEGDGVEQSYDSALKWYRLAAEKRSAEAMEMIGFLHAEGRGVKQDIPEAYFWYLLAISHGETLDLKDEAARLSPQQIADAQARVKKWQQAHGK